MASDLARLAATPWYGLLLLAVVSRLYIVINSCGKTLSSASFEVLGMGFVEGGFKVRNLGSLVNDRVISRTIAFPSLIVSHPRSEGEGRLRGHDSSGVLASMRANVMVPNRTAVTQSAAPSAGDGCTDSESRALKRAML